MPNAYEQDTKTLASGLTAKLIRRNGKWRIRSVETSWTSHGSTNTKTWFPDRLIGLDFDTKEAAYEYLERHAKLHDAPAPPEGEVAT